MRVSAQSMTAALLALDAAVPIGSWLILLFVAPNPGMSAIDSAMQQMKFTFSAESPDKLWFIWWAALPAILFVLAAAYLSRVARQPKGATALFAVTFAIALANLYLSPIVALVMVFPLYFGFISMRGQIKRSP